jgi:hypothetical protein
MTNPRSISDACWNLSARWAFVEATRRSAIVWRAESKGCVATGFAARGMEI